jgi:hypothetical protein
MANLLCEPVEHTAWKLVRKEGLQPPQSAGWCKSSILPALLERLKKGKNTQQWATNGCGKGSLCIKRLGDILHADSDPQDQDPSHNIAKSAALGHVYAPI